MKFYFAAAEQPESHSAAFDSAQYNMKKTESDSAVQAARKGKTMQIRRAMSKDIPGILKLLVQVDMVHHNGRPDLFKGPATKYNAEELEQLMADDTAPVFVCTEGDAVLGHAFCIQKQEKNNAVLTDIKTLYIDDICVDETMRGRHIGRMLYEHVLSYARENGFYNITLNVWTCNPGAMKFYETLGLKPQKIGMEMIV